MDKSFNIYYQSPWKTVPSNNYTHTLVSLNAVQEPTSQFPFHYSANLPIDLVKSIEGKYFIGMAEDLNFGSASSMWARLYNPPDSGVNMFVNVWTVSEIVSSPIRVQVWFNANPPGIVLDSEFITPTNTSLVPSPQPKVKLQYAIGVKGFPDGGKRAYGRSGTAGATIISEENGKFIFPPGGSFLIFVGNPETPAQLATGRISFGWWEEPINSL